MHYHTEIIMPPTDDIEATIAQIMAPFDENREDEDDVSSHKFWDWYVIGGRWSGHKLMAILGQERIDEFHKTLSDKRITVSSLTMGKQTLNPPEQAELVDRLWNEAFPESPMKRCPLFDNYNDNYGDVLPVSEMPRSLAVSTVIIAGPSWDEKKIAADLLLHESIWNGVNHQKTAWDGTLGAALTDHAAKLENYKEEYRAKHMVQPDWLVVTVDYHS